MQGRIKFYSIADDRVVMDSTLSTKEKAEKLGRSEMSIYARTQTLKRKINNATDKQIAVQRIAPSSRPVSFVMNGIKINIAGVKSLSIENNHINIES